MAVEVKEHRVNFDDIVSFFNDYEFADDEIELNQCTIVTNIEKFITSHISIIEANRHSSVKTRIRLTPYWDRLLQMYKMLNLKWDV